MYRGWLSDRDKTLLLFQRFQGWYRSYGLTKEQELCLLNLHCTIQILTCTVQLRLCLNSAVQLEQQHHFQHLYPHWFIWQRTIKLLFEIIFFLFTFCLSYVEVKRVRQMGFKLHVQGFWNQVSMFVVFLCIIGTTIFIERSFIISQIMHQYRESHGKTFVIFNLGILWDNIFIFLIFAPFSHFSISVRKIFLLTREKSVLGKWLVEV